MRLRPKKQLNLNQKHAKPNSQLDNSYIYTFNMVLERRFYVYFQTRTSRQFLFYKHFYDKKTFPLLDLKLFEGNCE